MASPAVGGGGGYENSNGTLSMKQEHGGHVSGDTSLRSLLVV